MKFSWKEWLPWRKWRIGAVVDAADEVPERLPPKVAVLVGSTAHPKWLAFDCPCGEVHRIVVSLDLRHRQLCPGPQRFYRASLAKAPAATSLRRCP